MEIKVVKIGGNIVDNPQLLEDFIRDFASIPEQKILVHGGGVIASNIQKRLGLEPIMIDGRRATDIETLKIVTMVYAGWCSKSIVALLQKCGCDAIGLSGADGNLIEATKRPPVQRQIADGRVVTIDYGFVGDIEDINVTFLEEIISMGITPVVCAITHDKKGNLLNTNADTVASNLAVALATHKAKPSPVNEAGVSLIYCFEKDGVLYDIDDESSIIEKINIDDYEKLKKERRISLGMLPKLDNSFDALRAGVKQVIIKHARNLLSDRGTILSL